MSLGPDRTICKDEFVEAMRVRLEADEPGSGGIVDDQDVQKNLGALGRAVYRIATLHAETVSDADTDSEFWQWIADVNAWLAALAAWQQSVDQAFAAWSPMHPAEQGLRSDLIAAPNPGSPPVFTPTSLGGRVE